ncbi:hypothetical protein [Tardisphaera saccharovorans]
MVSGSLGVRSQARVLVRSGYNELGISLAVMLMSSVIMLIYATIRRFSRSR